MNTKMKIMQVITQLQRGGAELLLLQICSGLIQKDRNIEIKVISLSNKLDLASQFEKKCIKVICINSEDDRFFKKIYKIYKQIKKFNPVIVHSHLLNADRYSFIAAFLAGVKHRICTAHNMEPEISRPEKISRVISSLFAEKIIAVSNSAKKFYIEKKMYTKRKLTVIPNCPGFKPENVQPRKLESNTEIIKLVNIGKMSRQKGQLYLIRAMKKLNNEKYKYELDIFGGWNQTFKKILEDEVKRLNLNNVYFRGIITNIQEMLIEKHIMVISSLWEGMPLTVLEGMSVGIPIIASDIPPLREILDGVDQRIFVNPKDPDAIAEVVTMLIEDPYLYNKISVQILMCAKQYTIENTVNNHYNFYTSIVNQ